MKNKYVKRSKISEAKFRRIIMYFCLELDAQKIAALTSLNRNTINRYLGRIRSRLVELCERQAPRRRAADAICSDRRQNEPSLEDLKPSTNGLPVFGIRSRHDHIHTTLLPNGIHRQLRRWIRGGDIGRVPQQWRHYDGIVDLNGRCHYRLGALVSDETDKLTVKAQIEAFLGFARKRLTNFNLNGIDHFYLGLKECEFRFNHRNEDLYQLLLRQFRERPLV